LLLNITHHLSPIVKNAGDTTSLGAVLLYMINVLDPIFKFVIVVATAVWFILRAVDLAWTLWERWEARKKKKSGD